MLNFRKLRQDVSSAILKEGKELNEASKVTDAKILHIDGTTVRIAGHVMGQFDNAYAPEIEIDRAESELVDSDCDCPYQFDCQHISALLFYVEQHMDRMLVEFSKETDLEELVAHDEETKEMLLEAVKAAETKVELKKDEQFIRQIMEEYVGAATHLASSPFFLPPEKKELEPAEMVVIVSLPTESRPFAEYQLALRLPSRSKPLYISHMRSFFEGLRYTELQILSGKRYYFGLNSFSEQQRPLIEFLLEHSMLAEKTASDRIQKLARLDAKRFGQLLTLAQKQLKRTHKEETRHVLAEEDLPRFSPFFVDSVETPLLYSPLPANIVVNLEYIEPPASKILLNPQLILDGKTTLLEEVYFFEGEEPCMLHKHIFYCFQDQLTRQHIRMLKSMREVTVPEPLFGAFIENALTQLMRFAKVGNQEIIASLPTLPYLEPIKAECELSYLNGEMEAQLFFIYGERKIPASFASMSFEQMSSFVTSEGIIARNIAEEKMLIDELFHDFQLDPSQQVFMAKTEKKIVEFMTDIVPRFSNKVLFHCPPNLLDQFIYDETSYTLSLSHTDRMDVYLLKLEVHGALKGISMDRLWDCIVSKRAYVELESQRSDHEGNRLSKFLVLDLKKMTRLTQLFDELGITKLDNHTLERPLWSLANIDASQFENLPVKFSVTKRLREIREQMLGEKSFDFTQVPEEVKASLRSYQLEGVNWLERLRTMYLNGILADDMGLGKTLQAIVAISQNTKKTGEPSLIVCPTSLVYNWKEEFARFNSELKVLVIDGMPQLRKKLIHSAKEYDVLVTSYTLLQKDIDLYSDISFSYMVLDEAQHIKNRGTRNARSVKMVKAMHRLILSGTPIENSLDELWSLFDFLMPGFLSSYDRFIEKYVRASGEEHLKSLEYLKKKVSPFILRRMKSDVLSDLPPVSEITYRCHLSDVQQALYRSYAESARDELVKLVERDGFDKVQIHVLATLTRLKQICCHPAIFAKEEAEVGDSAKYDMMLDLLDSLLENGHKTVIFSQYTRMLQIMRNDFEAKGIRFHYLDGSSKNRLEIVRQFNEDSETCVFLVSLKAGGTGLNLVGADTVIHYDMWWNPAVESQATDRVHRLGQNNAVSVYKLITMGTIEEKIVEMQNRKKGIVKKIVSCDDEAITKLTWEDVLELLQA